jgi:membrane protein DedA with SNARE-associated domain
MIMEPHLPYVILGLMCGIIIGFYWGWRMKKSILDQISENKTKTE